LGNPGPEYARTRHNLGFLIVDALKVRMADVREDRAPKWVSYAGRLSGQAAVLLKPMTYVNLSGSAVSEFVSSNEVPLDRIVVCCDDVWLPFGRIRIRPVGGDGGHNGLRSIIEALETEEFGRLRVGIGPGSEDRDLADFVLDEFPEDQQARLPGVIDRACDALETLLQEGIEKAMNLFNMHEEI